MVIYVIKSFFVHFFCVFLSPLFNFFLLMLGRWCFCPFLFLSLYKTFPWYLQFSLKRSLVFPILLFSSIYLHWLPRKTFFSLFAIFWNSAFSWVYLSLSALPLASLLFSTICKSSSDNHFAFFHFFFLGAVFIINSYTMLWTSIHRFSGTLPDLFPWM